MTSFWFHFPQFTSTNIWYCFMSKSKIYNCCCTLKNVTRLAYHTQAIHEYIASLYSRVFPPIRSTDIPDMRPTPSRTVKPLHIGFLYKRCKFWTCYLRPKKSIRNQVQRLIPAHARVLAILYLTPVSFNRILFFMTDLSEATRYRIWRLFSNVQQHRSTPVALAMENAPVQPKALPLIHMECVLSFEIAFLIVLKCAFKR